MDVPLYDATGLRIYRELMHRETKCAADWHRNYGPEALQRVPDPITMLNLGKFSKFQSMPMPLDVQLRELRKEKRAQSAKVTRYEKATYPQRSDIPVSETSVRIWGEKAWHSQPKKGNGAPASFSPYLQPVHKFTRRKWDVDRIQHTRESLGVAHVHARLAAEGALPPRVKPAWQF